MSPKLHAALKNMQSAHEFRRKCKAEGDSALETGAMRDAHEWCRQAGEEVDAVLVAEPLPELED